MRWRGSVSLHDAEVISRQTETGEMLSFLLRASILLPRDQLELKFR